MTISFELPHNIERRVRVEGADPGQEAKEAYLLDLYRRERISHDDLSEALGLGFHQMQQLIKEHGVGDDFTLEEFEAERAVLRGLERR
jgi:predicted HTH domain antitoxin